MQRTFHEINCNHKFSFQLCLVLLFCFHFTLFSIDRIDYAMCICHNNTGDNYRLPTSLYCFVFVLNVTRHTSVKVNDFLSCYFKLSNIYTSSYLPHLPHSPIPFAPDFFDIMFLGHFRTYFRCATLFSLGNFFQTGMSDGQIEGFINVSQV